MLHICPPGSFRGPPKESKMSPKSSLSTSWRPPWALFGAPNEAWGGKMGSRPCQEAQGPLRTSILDEFWWTLRRLFDDFGQFFVGFVLRPLQLPFRVTSDYHWYTCKEFVAQWVDHLELLRSYRVFCLGLILALGMMALQSLGIWAVQMSLGQEFPFWTTILVMAALNLAMIFPITPGNLGVYETTAFLIYKFSGLSAEISISLAFLQHICFLIPMAGTGWIVLFVQFLKSIKGKNSE